MLSIPELKSLLNQSQQTEKEWDQLVPSRSQPSLSSTAVDALSAWLAKSGRFRVSLPIQLEFHGFLRAIETFRLNVADIGFPNVPWLAGFLSPPADYVVLNANKKREQFTLLPDRTMLRHLQRFVRSKPASAPSLFQFFHSHLSAAVHDALVHL